jgi:hypothetical protein
MTRATRLGILALFCAVTLAACGGERAANSTSASNQAVENINSAKTSVEDLGLLINVPYEAEDCLWKVNPANKKLTAVFHFDAQDTAKVIAEAEKVRPAEPVSIASQNWFPQDMIIVSEVSGDEQLKGKAYAADQFFQEPYTSGRLVRIEGTDYFVLELTAK